MVKIRKAITPVVAITLLLIITIGVYIIFNNWFVGFSSSQMADVTNAKEAYSKNIKVEDIAGDNLYVYSSVEVDNLTSLKIGGVECNVSGVALNKGMNEINVSICLNGVTVIVPEVVLFTSSQIVRNTVMLDYIRVNCSKLDGGEWVKVPGNDLYGTRDFCVMKYEAKWDGFGVINDSVAGYCGNNNDYNESTGCPLDGSIGIVSQPEGLPLTMVNRFEAIKLCQNLGENYHLISDSEWMTIARNVEKVPSNWVDGVVGSTIASGGGLRRGNLGSETVVSYNGDNPEEGIGRNEKALLNLTNGEGIWDLSGNVWEWTNKDVYCHGVQACSRLPYDSTPGLEWIEYSALDTGTYGELSYDLLRPSNSTWGSDQGFGNLYTTTIYAQPGDSLWNTTYTFARGGYWFSFANGGILSLSLYNAPSAAHFSTGFRCAYSE